MGCIPDSCLSKYQHKAASNTDQRTPITNVQSAEAYLNTVKSTCGSSCAVARAARPADMPMIGSAVDGRQGAAVNLV